MKSKKQYDYEIGKAIQKARKRKKMNQEALPTFPFLGINSVSRLREILR